MIISNIGCILAIKYVFAGFEPHWTQTLNMKTIYLKHPPKGDKCCDPWHVRGLEYNYYVTPRIHLMRVYGTCVIRLIHHYACECIIRELGASILGAIHHEQAGSGCWAVQNKVNCKGLYARKLDTLQTNKLWLGRTTQEEGPRYRYWKWKKSITWHYAGPFHTSLHFTSGSWHEVHLQFWLLANTTKKWNCPSAQLG